MNTKLGKFLYNFPNFWLFVISLIGLTGTICGGIYSYVFNVKWLDRFALLAILFVPLVYLNYRVYTKELKHEKH